MNSFVNVQVRILAAQAQRQLDALEKRIGGLEKAFGKAGRGATGFSRVLGGMRLDAFGSKLQWVGRQIEYNFTLPIVAAATAAYQMALANEAAFTRVEKVYGDAAHGAEFYSKELQALRRNFEALSNAYGVNQEETIKIAAAWAAAGSSGIALAKSVDLTLQTMILGELKAADATTALISIQAQYGYQTEDLIKVLHTLNMVENETATSLADLITGFAKAAGVARTAGVDHRNLAAMIAAITPAAGTASQAGNALKTIFSKLLSPTREVVQVLGMIGVHTDSLSWKSASMTEKLKILSGAFEELSDAEKGVVATTIAGAWQVNRFSVLMRELANEHGYYAKAINSTEDATAVFTQAQKELNTVLSSSPRRLQIIWTMLQNAGADIIQPLIPLLLYLATVVQKVVTWFSNLNPAVQKLIVTFALFIAVVGPLTRIAGAMILLFGQLINIFGLFLIPIRAVTSALYTLVKVPIVWFFTSLSKVVQASLRMLLLLGPAWNAAMNAIRIAVILGSRAFMATYFIATTAIVTGTNALMTTLQWLWYAGTRLIAMSVATAGMAIRQAYWALTLGIYATITKGFALITAAWRAFHFIIIALTVNFRSTMVALWTGFVTFFRGIIPTIRAIGLAIGTAMTGPWGLAIGAVIALVIAFWDELVQLFHAGIRALIQAWNALPEGVRNALLAVVRIVNAAVMRVYEALQWMNPWARHSPSLVENVTSGMQEIARQYSAADEIVKIFEKAGLTLEEFGKAVKKVQREADLQDIADQREALKSFAADALPYFDQLVSVLFPLKDLLSQIGDEVAAQQAAVDGWRTQLDAANVALEEQEKILNDLQDVANGYKDELDKAQADLDKFANAPIQGMKAMEDAIFENQMASKQARLELLRMEQAVGPLDELNNRISNINGELELMQGEQKALRNAGAGSDILSFYDDQITALEDGKQAIIDQVTPLQELADEIERLGTEAEMLDLEKSLAFDPLKKQIDDLINSMEELPFDEILAGVVANAGEVERLTEAYNEANAAVEAQQAIVDGLKAQRDAIQASYDVELAKLRALQDEYDLVEDKIRAIEQALMDLNKANGGAGGLTPGAENLLNAAGGDFPDVGGVGGIGREGGLEDQSKLIDDFTKEIADKTKNMFGLFDFLEPVKKAWNTATGWLKENVGPFFGTLFGGIGDALGGIGNPFEKFSSWVDTFKSIWNGITEGAKVVWEVIGPEIVSAGKEIWAALQDAFKTIQPEIEKFRGLIGPIGEALMNVWNILKPVLAVVLGLILAIVKGLIRAFTGAIGPVIRAIGGLIAGLIKTIRGLVEFVVGVFTGDWEMAWQGIKDFFGGIWDSIWSILKGVVTGIWGLIKGFVTGIYDFFVWLWDELVGHSVVPDIVDGILYWFDLMWKGVKFIVDLLVKGIMWAWQTFIKPVFDAFGAALNVLKVVFTAVFNFIKLVWDEAVKKFQWAWGKINEYITFVKNIITSMKDNFMSNVNTVKSWIDKLITWVNDLKNKFKFTGLFDGIKDAFKNAVNWLIGKWNNLSFTIGGGSFLGQSFPGMTISTPNIPYLARGGLIANEAMAVVGEGRKGYPEYVIPTDPIYRNRALGLFANLAQLLGVGNALSGNQFQALDKIRGFNHGASAQFFASGGILGRGNVRGHMRGGGAVVFAPENNTRVINFYGDLEFPNVRDGQDVEEFLRNLEALISEG